MIIIIDFIFELTVSPRHEQEECSTLPRNSCLATATNWRCARSFIEEVLIDRISHYTEMKSIINMSNQYNYIVIFLKRLENII